METNIIDDRGTPGRQAQHQMPKAKGISILTKGYLLLSHIQGYFFGFKASRIVVAAIAEAPALPKRSFNSS